MPDYRERLTAAPWFFIATALVIPASILVLAPISIVAGYITAAVLYGAIVFSLIATAPLVEVINGELRAGHARIPLSLLGEAVALNPLAASHERGPGLDVRAFLLIRGGIAPAVRIPVLDQSDPAPYWLLSSRHPEEMAAAINRSRRPENGASA